MDDQKTLGMRIRALREGRGLTQNQLAKKTGFSAMRISHIEQGNRDLKLEDLYKIATVLGVAIGEIMHSIPNQSSKSAIYGRIAEVDLDQQPLIKKAIEDFDKHLEEKDSDKV